MSQACPSVGQGRAGDLVLGMHHALPPPADCPQVQCVHPYVAQQPDELTLELADILNILEKTEDGEALGLHRAPAPLPAAPAAKNPLPVRALCALLPSSCPGKAWPRPPTTMQGAALHRSDPDLALAWTPALFGQRGSGKPTNTGLGPGRAKKYWFLPALQMASCLSSVTPTSCCSTCLNSFLH